jgi:hypothetical protein
VHIILINRISPDLPHNEYTLSKSWLELCRSVIKTGMKCNARALQAKINNFCSRFLFTSLDIIGIILVIGMIN